MPRVCKEDLPYKKMGLLIIPFRGKKLFWYLLGSTALKGLQKEIFQCLLVYWAKKMTGDI